MEDHRALMGWALGCTFHVLPRVLVELDDTLAESLLIAQRWSEGTASTGDCITASRQAHAIAKHSENPLLTLLARCIGQTVATAHIADHCIGGSWYARKIVRMLGEDVEQEHAWQRERLNLLTPHLSELIASSPKFNAKP